MLAGRLGGFEVEGHAERVLPCAPRQLGAPRRVRGEGTLLARGEGPPAALEPDEELAVAGALEGQDEAILGAGDGLPGSALLLTLGPRCVASAHRCRQRVDPTVPGGVGARHRTGVGPDPEGRPRRHHEGRGRRKDGRGELAAPDQRGHRTQPGLASAGLLAVELLSQPGQAAPQPRLDRSDRQLEARGDGARWQVLVEAQEHHVTAALGKLAHGAGEALAELGPGEELVGRRPPLASRHRALAPFAPRRSPSLLAQQIAHSPTNPAAQVRDPRRDLPVQREPALLDEVVGVVRIVHQGSSQAADPDPFGEQGVARVRGVVGIHGTTGMPPGGESLR